MDASTQHAPHLVKIEAKRIQTFLFAVPRLKEMLGANALLGDAFRRKLPRLLDTRGQGATYRDPAPPTFVNDPLSDGPRADNPAVNFGQGILSREGGHFVAQFPSKPAAEKFADDARRELAELTPGLRLSLVIEAVHVDDSSSHREQQPALATQFIELPQFQVCRASAKKAFLQVPGEPAQGDQPPQRSVVDWAVVTSSWAASPIDERRRRAGLFSGPFSGPLSCWFQAFFCYPLDDVQVE